MEMSCRLLRRGAKVEQPPWPLHRGTRVTTALGRGTPALRPSAIRDLLRTLRFNLLLLFSFFQEKKMEQKL